MTAGIGQVEDAERAAPGATRAGAQRKNAMPRIDATIKLTLAAIALFLGMIALRPYFEPLPVVHADVAKFDHVQIISAVFLYQGQQGLLLLDKRNGNIWFSPRLEAGYGDPVYLIRLPFEKLDQTPR
jgi:hypothetical protein